ncbi:MAG: winged helix-turn-helix domain-containing protein [Sporomusaceae bacterium]|nr:winged helix-turn-helix domain-containing protein [Sporomusaceae bacterium]
MIVQRLGLPIYLQVKGYVLDKIKSGELQPGDRLPTERDLAKTLEISRNTVSAAYKELLLEGILEARQGKGTFVKKEDQSYESATLPGSRLERMMKIIDEAMQKGLELGFTVDQFTAIANVRAREKEVAVRHLRIAVVDETPEYLRRFLQQLSSLAVASLEGVVLADLLSGKTSLELLKSCDYVVTTTAHLAQVAKLWGSSDKLITLSVTPKLEAVIKLARIPVYSKVGIVAESEGFAKSVRELLGTVTVGDISVSTALNYSKEELKAFCQEQTILIVPEEEQGKVAALTTPEQQVVAFYYEIDQGSLHQLMSRIVSQSH